MTRNPAILKPYPRLLVAHNGNRLYWQFTGRPEDGQWSHAFPDWEASFADHAAVEAFVRDNPHVVEGVYAVASVCSDEALSDVMYHLGVEEVPVKP